MSDRNATGGNSKRRKVSTAGKPGNAPGRVWEAYGDIGGDGTFEGFLVTEAGDAGRLIAHVWGDDVSLLPGAWDSFDPVVRAARYKNVAIAQAIAADPDAIAKYPTVARDLRKYSRLDSEEPTPAKLYEWNLSPLHHGPNHVAARCFPFCRFRLAKLIELHNRMVWTPEELAANGQTFIGVTEGEDSASFLDRYVNVAIAGIPL